MLQVILSLLLMSGVLSPNQSEVSHDIHVSIGRMAVEGNQAMLQIRLFQDDLELALQNFHSDNSLRLKVDPQTDSLFMHYLNEKLVIKYGNEALKGVVVASGEDMLNGYPVWWYSLMYQASSTIDSLAIDHQVLMEIFDDQQNVIRITHYPSDNERMYYMVGGDSEVEVEF